MSRRKFTAKFKTKAVIEALKEKSSLAELAQRFNIHPQQISNWKREFLNGTEDVFGGKKKTLKSEIEESEGQHL